MWADPFTAELGYVQTRVTESDGRCADQALALQDGCLSCTLRTATVRAVQRLRRTGRYDATRGRRAQAHLCRGAPARTYGEGCIHREQACLIPLPVLIRAGWEGTGLPRSRLQRHQGHQQGPGQGEYEYVSPPKEKA